MKGMNRIHTAALALTAAIAFFVGGWAFFAPASFYDSFPGVLGQWVSTDGPYNEHLVRDVGAMYLALGTASVAGLVWRSPVVSRLLGLAWTVFGMLHLGYHLMHLDHLAVADAVGVTVSVSFSLALGVVLLIPGRGPGRGQGRGLGRGATDATGLTDAAGVTDAGGTAGTAASAPAHAAALLAGAPAPTSHEEVAR